MLGVSIRVKKNRHRWRFLGILLVSRIYVNLPLLHRLGVGMAKVKPAGKGHATHHQESLCLTDYSNNKRNLSSPDGTKLVYTA
jgi:hypothetical protein